MTTAYVGTACSGWFPFHHWTHASAYLSPSAKKNLAWFDHYRKTKSVAKTCRYFGISRKTLYHWQKRYATNALVSLESKSSAPIKKRQRMITPEQEMRILSLRRRAGRGGASRRQSGRRRSCHLRVRQTSSCSVVKEWNHPASELNLEF